MYFFAFLFFCLFVAQVETELFPRGALEFYTKKNMGWEYTQEESDQWLLPERGGEQGDYRDGMQAKIANVSWEGRVQFLSFTDGLNTQSHT